jgi:transposase
LTASAEGPRGDGPATEARQAFSDSLEQGAFRWPPITDGVMRLSASQLAALMDGLDWSRLHARDVAQPTATL